MEETITMTEILARIVRGWKRLCAAALVFALLLAGIQSFRLLRQAKNPENAPEAIEQRYQDALESYTLEKEKLEEELAANEESLSSKQEYAADSLLMAIDPYDVYTTRIVLAFTGISENGAVQGVSQYQTSADYLVQTVRSQYLVLWQGVDYARDLGLARYADTLNKYLAELITVTGADGGLCSISVKGATAADAEELADAVYGYFQRLQSVVSASSYANTLSLVSRSTQNTVDDALISKHTSLDDEILSLETRIEELQAQLDGLTEPQREAGFAASALVKSAVKYALLGAVLGLVLGCFAGCCLSVFGTRISSSYQLERLASLPFLGSVRLPRSVMDRFANRLIAERSWTDAALSGAFLVSQVRPLCPDGGTLLVLSTLSEKTDLSALTEPLTAAGFTVRTVLDAAHNPETAQAAAECGAVVLAERVDQSRMGAVADVTAALAHAGKKAVGFALV